VMDYDSSHELSWLATYHTMMTQEKTTNGDKYVAIRVRQRTKERLAQQGFVGQTFDQALQGALDRLETCRCRGPGRLTR
jgi:hypothetical protein